MPAVLRRHASESSSSCTESSSDDNSTTPSSASSRSARGFRNTVKPIPPPISLCQPLSSDPFLVPLNSPDLEALLSARLASQTRNMACPSNTNSPPSLGNLSEFPQSSSTSSISSASTKKKGFGGLFSSGGNKISRSPPTSSAARHKDAARGTPPSRASQEAPRVSTNTPRINTPTPSPLGSPTTSIAPQRIAIFPTTLTASPSYTKVSLEHLEQRQPSRRTLVLKSKKLSSKSPQSEQPPTWELYAELYAKYDIDIEDPPLPPMRNAMEAVAMKYLPPTPFDERVWVAPRPINESNRQAIVSQLDLFGSRRPASYSPSMTAPPSSSLENHPAFRSIVQKCRDTFDTRIGMLSLLDGEDQLFLATGGMPEGVDVLPRGSTFCQHTILNEDRGMIVLDSQLDWRFANNMPSAVLGTRFYAGVPLLAPAFGDLQSLPVTIGTLCVLDDRPRASFSAEQREQLRDFAAEVCLEIERWVKINSLEKVSHIKELFQEAKIGDHLPSSPSYASCIASPAFPPSTFSSPSARASPNMNSPAFASHVFASPSTRAGPGLNSAAFDSGAFAAPAFFNPAAPTPKSTLPYLPPLASAPTHDPGRQAKSPPTKPPTSCLPPTPPQSRSPSSSASSVAKIALPSDSDWSHSSGASSDTSSIKSPGGLALRVGSDDPVSPLPKDLKETFDTASRMLAKALKLDLVYLVSLNLADPRHNLTLLASCGLPTPAPSFDPGLHFKALRAPEGGLLYSNSSNGGQRGSGMASGILIPILEVRRSGYVLCGYTADPSRAFGERDMTFFVKFAEQLEPWVSRVGRV